MAALIACACGGEATPELATTYVGRAACASCHAAQVEAWSGSHHDLAMQEATEQTVLGAFDGTSFTHSGVTSTFYKDEEQFRVRTEGRDGTPTEYDVAYTFGVEPLQQYVVRFPRGAFQMLAIAWDTRPSEDGGQRWFHLYPESDTGPESPLHWTRPSQNWNTVCVECHTTNLERGFDPVTRTFSTTWSEIDVSCEACHGPGALHVSLAETLADGTRDLEAGHGWGLAVTLGDADRGWSLEAGATTATLVQSPVARRQVETCAACHSRRAALTDAPAHGGALLESYSVSLLREDLYHADGQIREEVYVYGSFVQSKMYAAGVTCSDCHEPHSLTTRANGNALCAQCHQASHFDDPSHHFHEARSAGAQCVECHMPETTYMEVDPRRDHSLRIPRPDLTEEIGVPNACSRCHADRSPSWAVDAAERWWGGPDDPGHYGIVLHSGRSGDPAAAPDLATLAADTAQPAIARGSALALLAAHPSDATLSAIRTSLADPEALVRLGAIQALSAFDPAAVTALAIPALSDEARAVRLPAARLLASQPRTSQAPAVVAAIDRATADYELAQRRNAHQSGSWVALGDLYVSQQRVAEARSAYETALQLDSTDLVASLNFADLSRALRQDDVAEEVLVAALRYHEGSAELLHAIGLLRVRQGRTEEALDWLARAAVSNPDDARFPYVYAVALASGGDVSVGIEVLESTLAAHPYDRDVLTALASYHRDLGRSDRALAYAERLSELAPDDPQVTELLRRLRATLR